MTQFVINKKSCIVYLVVSIMKCPFRYERICVCTLGEPTLRIFIFLKRSIYLGQPTSTSMKKFLATEINS